MPEICQILLMVSVASGQGRIREGRMRGSGFAIPIFQGGTKLHRLVHWRTQNSAKRGHNRGYRDEAPVAKG